MKDLDVENSNFETGDSGLKNRAFTKHKSRYNSQYNSRCGYNANLTRIS